MFHLIAHAFFKALLFLSSGSVIHGMEHGHHHLHEHGHGEGDDFDPQDMRTMGGLRHRMKITTVVFTIGALALAGIFPLAGFWSKDEILAHAWFNTGTDYTVVFFLLTVAAFCTAFYMGRQLKMVFFGQPRHEAAKHASESPPIMTTPLIILAVLSVLGGILNLPFFSERGAEVAEEAHELGFRLLLEQGLEHAIEAFELTEEALLNLPETPTWLLYNVAGISTVLGLLGLVLAVYVVYRRRPQTAEEPDPLERIPFLWRFFAVLPLNTFYYSVFVPAFNRSAHWLAYTLDDKIWHDWFHDRVLRDGYLFLSEKLLNQWFDTGFIDNFLVNGSGRAARWLAGQLRRTQTGYIRNYALAVILGVVILLTYFIFLAG